MLIVLYFEMAGLYI